MNSLSDCERTSNAQGGERDECLGQRPQQGLSQLPQMWLDCGSRYTPHRQQLLLDGWHMSTMWQVFYGHQ